MSFSTFELVLIIGIVQALVAAVCLLFSDNNRRSNLLLALTLIIFCTSQAKMLLHTQQLWNTQYGWFFPFSTELLHAPIFYLYAYSLIIPEQQPLQKQWRHLIPGLLFLLHALIVYGATCTTPDILEKQGIATRFFNTFFDQLEEVLAVIWNVAYALMSLRLIKTFKQQVLDYAGDELVKSLSWLQAIYYSLIGMVGLAILVFGADILFDFGQTHFWHIQTFHIAMALLSYLLGWYGIRQLGLPSHEGFKNNAPIEHDALEVEKMETWFPKVQGIMEDQQLFLDPTMNLPTFARHVQLPAPEISQIIKKKTGRSFRDFLNAYRVSAFQQKLNDPRLQHLSILGLAYESGFNSEASFYRIFKKATGLSPSAYRQQQG